MDLLCRGSPDTKPSSPCLPPQQSTARQLDLPRQPSVRSVQSGRTSGARLPAAVVPSFSDRTRAELAVHYPSISKRRLAQLRAPNGERRRECEDWLGRVVEARGHDGDSRRLPTLDLLLEHGDVMAKVARTEHTLIGGDVDLLCAERERLGPGAFLSVSDDAIMRYTHSSLYHFLCVVVEGKVDVSPDKRYAILGIYENIIKLKNRNAKPLLWESVSVVDASVANKKVRVCKIWFVIGT